MNRRKFMKVSVGSGAALVALCRGIWGLPGTGVALYLAALCGFIGAVASFSRLHVR